MCVTVRVPCAKKRDVVLSRLVVCWLQSARQRIQSQNTHRAAKFVQGTR